MIRTTTPRRQPEPDRVPLPAETRAALRAIAADLRNMPRDCIGDRAELLFWLNRIARRVDAERDRTVVVAPRPKPGFRPRSVSAVDRAEAVFKPGSQSTPAASRSTPMPPKPRTVTSRKGRSVRVEIRRSLQIEMGF